MTSAYSNHSKCLSISSQFVHRKIINCSLDTSTASKNALEHSDEYRKLVICGEASHCSPSDIELSYTNDAHRNSYKVKFAYVIATEDINLGIADDIQLKCKKSRSRCFPERENNAHTNRNNANAGKAGMKKKTKFSDTRRILFPEKKKGSSKACDEDRNLFMLRSRI